MTDVKPISFDAIINCTRFPFLTLMRQAENQRIVIQMLAGILGLRQNKESLRGIKMHYLPLRGETCQPVNCCLYHWLSLFILKN